MPQQHFDKSSKWLIEEHGAAVLYVAGERSIVSCRALQAEVVQPRQLPDGLLEVRLAGRKEPALVLVEVATYPEKRVPGQVHDDVMLVRQARGVLPETVVIVLARRGTYRVPAELREQSGRGWTTSTISWKVVELWTLSAEDLLAAPNVGAVPLAALARYDGPPEVLLRRCRERIDRDGGDQRANLLAVTQVYARMHFDQPRWLDILGGKKTMIESPLIRELEEEFKRAERVDAIVQFLGARFGPVPPGISAGLVEVKTKDGLGRLTTQAALCSTFQAFEDKLREELSSPPPASTRRKPRGRKPAE